MPPPLRRRRLRFRTYSQSIWAEPNEPWLREARAHCRSVCVRVNGLAANDRVKQKLHPDDERLLNWERHMEYLVGRRHRPMAFLILTVGRYPGRSPLLPGYRASLSPLRKYRRQSVWAMGKIHQRVGMMLRLLAGELGCSCSGRGVEDGGGSGRPLIVQGEDFACRWILDAQFTPDILVFDQPIIRYNEVDEDWAERLRVPGVIRRAKFLGMKWWPYTKLDRIYKEEELITAHLTPAAHRVMSLCQIGEWRRSEHYRAHGPLIDQINLPENLARLMR